MPDLQEFMKNPDSETFKEGESRSVKLSGAGGKLSQQYHEVADILFSMYEGYKHNHGDECVCSRYGSSTIRHMCLCQAENMVRQIANFLEGEGE